MRTLGWILIAAVGVALAPTGVAGQSARIFEGPIPAAPGYEIESVIFEIAPTRSTDPATTVGMTGHTHPASTYAYVLSGTVISRLGDGPEQTFVAGQSWSELPGEAHFIVNASPTEPARLLVTFIHATGTAPLIHPLVPGN